MAGRSVPQFFRPTASGAGQTWARAAKRQRPGDQDQPTSILQQRDWIDHTLKATCGNKRSRFWDPRPYHCHQCTKTFRRPSCLKRHELTHTGEKPYVCIFCGGRGFTREDSLKRHMQRFHPGAAPGPCTTRSSDIHVTELDPRSHEFKEVANLFNRTMAGQPIRAIRRVYNRESWNIFCAKRKEFVEARPAVESQYETAFALNPDVNERMLFHGTASENQDGIIKKNFLLSEAGKHGCALGRGIYFARDASYSSQFSTAQPGTSRVMFLARVLVGDYTTGSGRYMGPPVYYTLNGRLRAYDSCVDNVTQPRKYAVFDNRQIYPQYVIEF